MSLFGGQSNTAQKNKKKTANIGGDDVSTNQEGIPVPYLAGVAMVAVQWIAPVYNPTIKAVKTGGSKFSSPTVTGYKYFGDLVGLICLGPLDVIYAIIADSNLIWPSVKNIEKGWTTGGLFRTPGQDYANITIPKASLCTLFWGTDTQQPSQHAILKPRGTPPVDPNFDPRDPSTWPNNPASGGQQTFDDLASGDAKPKQGHYDLHPDYPGAALILFDQFHFGEGRNAAPSISVIVGKATDYFGATRSTLDLAGVIPHAILYEALANKRYGGGFDDADLDKPSFDALGAALPDLPLSALITQKTNHKDFLDQLRQYYDGWIRRRLGTKIIEIGYFNHGSLGTSFPHVTDDDRTAEPELKASGWGGTYNLFTVIYNNRHRYFKSDAERFADEANREAVGESRPLEIQAPFIVDPDTAQMYARQAGHLAALQSVTGTDTIKRERVVALGLNVGGRYYLDSTALNLSFLVNIMEMEWPKSADGSVKMTIEVERGTYPTPYFPPGAPHDQDFNFGPESIRQYKIVELPSELRDDPSATEIAVLALRPNIQVTGFRVWASLDNATFFEVTVENNFSAFGILNADYVDTTPNPDTTTGAQIYLYGVDQDNFVVSQTDAERDNGDLLLFIENDTGTDFEIVSVGQLTALGSGLFSVLCRRGMYKTGITYHSAGARCFFIPRSSLTINNNSNFSAGAQVYFKFQTHTQTLDDDLSVIDSVSYTFKTPTTYGAPSVSPGTGSYNTGTTQNVALSIDAGLVARYTLDSTPVTSSSPEWPKSGGVYTTLPIAASCTLRVQGFDSLGNVATSAILATYTFVASGAGTPTAASPSFSFSGTKGATGGTLTMSSSTPSPTIKYTKNGGGVLTYSVPITIALNDVIVAHTEASGYSNSPDNTFDNTYSGSGTPTSQVPDPVIIPIVDTYHNGGSFFFYVGIGVGLPQASIHYTTDGVTVPGEFGPGTSLGADAGVLGPFTATDSPLTIKAIASKSGSGLTASNVITFGPFVIDGAADSRAQIPDPGIIPAAGSYQVDATHRTFRFVVGSAIPGASFRYTLDGSTPTTGHGTSVPTQNCFNIDFTLPGGVTSKTWTLQVLAYGLGKTQSNVKTFSITLHL